MNNTTIITKPPIQILSYQEPVPPIPTVLQTILMFSHYLIAFPIFLLCWYGVINFLRKRGHISRKDADSMMEELKYIPQRSPVLLAQHGNGGRNKSRI